MNFAMRYQHYAQGIILLDTEAYFDVEHISAAFAQKGGEKIGQIAKKVFGKEIPDSKAFEDYFKHCIPLCSNNPIPESYMKRAIIKPEMSQYIQAERFSLNYLDTLDKIIDPVLYLTNTINPCHLFEAAKTSAEAMKNADLTFVPFKNCGIVQHDAKAMGINEIKKFIQRYTQ